MYHRQNKKLIFIFFLLIVLLLNSCLSTPKPSTIVVTRLSTNLDDGQLFVYVDGRVVNKKSPIGKGQSRNIAIPNGNHRISVKVDHFQSDTINFNADNNTTNFTASAQRVGGARVLILERNNN